jgi:hypothetical protein
VSIAGLIVSTGRARRANSGAPKGTFMKLGVILGTCLAVASPAWAQSDRSKNTETHDTRPEPPMMGKHLAKGQAKPGGGARVLPNLTYHNGPVITATTGARVIAILWGTSWTSTDVKALGLDAFYQGVGDSPYMNSNTEYTQSGGAHVGTAVSYGGHLVDNSASTGGSQTGPILSEVCKVLQQNHITPVANGYYPVYVDTKRGNAGFCAWHSWGSCGGVNMQFGFFFNLDNDPGCDPGDNETGHSQGLAAVANVSGHELSEMFTDPRGTGWFDRNGAENSDKCAWTFGPAALPFTIGTLWKVQGNWSNSANTLNQGYNDSGRVRGCIDGFNPVQ